MQVIIFIALMVSLALASPIGRYRNLALKPRYPHEGHGPYTNTTTTIQIPISSSDTASENMFIPPSTDSVISQPFSSAILPSRSFQNIKDGPPTEAPVITSTSAPVKTTEVPSTSPTSEIASSTVHGSFRPPSDAESTSLVVPSDTLTASTVTGSTSDAVVTPSPTVVPSDTLTASTITGSTSDAVVTPSTTLSAVPTVPTDKPSNGFHSTVRFPVITYKPIKSSVPITTASSSEPVPVLEPITSSVTIVTSEPTPTSEPTTSSVALTSASSELPTASEVITSSIALTTPVTSEPIATSAPIASASSESTATTSTVASPSGIAGDKFGNKQLAITENKQFTALDAASKCDPADPSAQHVCIKGAFAQCGSDGAYIIVSECAAPTKCFSMPLELSAGTSVGCTTPDDAAFRMGLGSAAELDSILAGGGADLPPPPPPPTTSVTSTAADTSVPAETTTAVSSTSLAPQEPKLPVPTGLTSSEVSKEATTAVAPTSSTPQEPKLPVPTGLVSSEVSQEPTPTSAYASITPAPAPDAGVVTVTATVATTVTVKG